jgi:hypothetical protein
VTTSVSETPIREGARVEFITGDLVGEPGTVVGWEFRDLRYKHEPNDPRRYWIEIDGLYGCVPALREQLLVCDEVDA